MFCGKRYAQIYGINYADTFSTVTKIRSVWLPISLAATYNWLFHQLDVKNATLHKEPEKEIYMEQPAGFVAQGKNSGVVCLPRKPLYGVKRSPRAWFGQFSSVVMEFGLKSCGLDHSIFHRHSNFGNNLLVVFVDDNVITRDDYKGIQQIKSTPLSNFQTEDLGLLRHFLGIKVA